MAQATIEAVALGAGPISQPETQRAKYFASITTWTVCQSLSDDSIHGFCASFQNAWEEMMSACRKRQLRGSA
jgi:hypothetical protein